MKSIVKNRLQEICPLEKMEDMDILEAEKNCNVAFKIIGYEPNDFEESLRKVWESSTSEYLCDFVYEVWEVDR